MNVQPPQSGPPTLRASDADRERTAAILRDNFSEGRLTLDEFQQRLEQAYAAQTVGQLTELTRDLPTATYAPPPVRTSALPTHLRRDAARFAAIALFLIVIWALTGGGSFWPIWAIVGMAFVLAMRLLGPPSGSSRRRGRARQDRDPRRPD